VRERGGKAESGEGHGRAVEGPWNADQEG
jgi:hypothetical protein